MQSVCVCGAAGRMGRSVVAAVEAEGDMRVAASVDPALVPGEGRYPSLPPALAAGGLDVVVDFTQPDVVFGNAREALRGRRPRRRRDHRADRGTG